MMVSSERKERFKVYLTNGIRFRVGDQIGNLVNTGRLVTIVQSWMDENVSPA